MGQSMTSHLASQSGGLAGGECTPHGSGSNDSTVLPAATGRAPQMTPAAFRTKVKAEMRQAIWEASQLMSSDDIKGFVDGVCEEIESDAA